MGHWNTTEARVNLWLRLFWYLVRLPWSTPLVLPSGTSIVRLRVLPNDLDTSGHLNNGRYLTMMDFGRLDIMMRTGMWRSVLRHRWTPIASSAIIRFRRELRLLQRFRLETRILAWDTRLLVIEHVFLHEGGAHDGAVAARALIKAGLYDRAARSFVDTSRLMTEIGVTAQSPRLTPEIEAFLAADEALRQPTA
jgi:acyl-CoA thioesterase FadM